ncbi:acetyltransferase [Rhodobacter sp. 24-YEA-8]|uniref:acetyltransferase n=1 Tax=Rhodobacter sp. 24-YEA-8 TaxID=1884310 RepID=UPI0008951BEE|nr:acetyltransferase [Rhodobacter sp. 24-YEA-8]SEB77889.1 hypothetical protein SAMN05519105_1291 [Rhodobacter sp. 24-YEA-8]
MAHSDTLPRDFGWVLLELMGHRQRVGRAREDEIAGSQMLRIDIPTEGDGYATEFYSASAIYAIRPVSEQIARDHYAARDPRPQRPIDYQPQIENHDGGDDA